MITHKIKSLRIYLNKELKGDDMMMLSELGGKEIINLNNGERLGIIADSDIIVDEKTGKIMTLLVPERRLQFKFFKESDDIEIPWHTIRKIGNDMVIVELEIF